MSGGFRSLPTRYIAPLEREYGSLDVYSFHVEPSTGDVYLHFQHTGLPLQVRIFADDAESFCNIITEEHDVRNRARTDARTDAGSEPIEYHDYRYYDERAAATDARTGRKGE